MNDTVTQFYAKNASEGYGDSYDGQHGFRLDAMVSHFRLGDLKNQRILDVGGGLGFLGKRLDPSNDYWVIDGAAVKPEQHIAKGTFTVADLDHDDFSGGYWQPPLPGGDEPIRGTYPTFNYSFICETLEHLSNPYHCLVEMKKLTKIGGSILISTPTIDVWHNTIYPSLLWPVESFELFLNQMALPVTAKWDYIPLPGKGWPAHHFLCNNRPWMEKRMLFAKQEAKFLHATPLEMTNL